MVQRNLFGEQEWKPRCRKQTCGHRGVGGGGGGVHWETGLTYTPHHRVPQTAGGKLLTGTEGPVWGSVTTWRGGTGQGAVRERSGRKGMYVPYMHTQS